MAPFPDAPATADLMLSSGAMTFPATCSGRVSLAQAVLMQIGRVVADQRGIWVAGGVGGNYDGFVRRYDFAGSLVWERVFGTPNEDYIEGMSLDPGGVTVTGPTFGTFFLGVIEPPGWGTPDVFVRRYDPDGNHLWTRQFSSQGKYQDETRGVAADAGGLTVAGFTRGATAGIHQFGRQ